MESNTYEVHGVDPDYWANFLKQSLTNIRKWGFTVCLTAHSDSQTAISSKLLGFSKNIDAAPRVECITTTNNDGEASEKIRYSREVFVNSKLYRAKNIHIYH